MFKFVLFFTALFSVLFTIYPATSIDQPPEFYLQWYFEPGSDQNLPRPSGWGAPFNTVLNRKADGSRSLVMPGREPVVPGEESLVWAPFHGAGYFEYRKVGKEIRFHDSFRGEILWTKTYYSYPVSDHYGNLILLLTGDGNRVDLIDPSGNPVGVKSVAGNILTDYDFAARKSRALLAFSDGTVTVLEEKGGVLFRHQLPRDGSPFFVKSSALGPDGKVAAVHYRSGGEDRVALLGREEDSDQGRLLGTARLPKIYPHLVHMAVNQSGLLVAAPDFTGFFDLDGDSVWNRSLALPAGARPAVYRPVYADRDFFLFGENTIGFMLDGAGRVVSLLPIETDDRPYRFLPGPVDGSFAIHTDAALHFYRFAARATD